ncbi:hypothetical protein SH501x_001139 [Pirellulaceae bacterium SH501]
MNVNDNPYRNIIAAIEDAGYYVSGPNQYVEPECTWNRIIPASKLRPQGGYTGNSFWISFDDGEWFIGVWGGRIYGIREPSNIASMAIEWMSAKPDGTFHDFDSWVIEKYDLYEIDENDFRPIRLMGDRND